MHCHMGYEELVPVAGEIILGRLHSPQARLGLLATKIKIIEISFYFWPLFR
jgi:hypothetical protein